MKKYKDLIVFIFSVFISLCVFFLMIDFFLKKHTNYNQLIEVPDVLGMSFQETHNIIMDLNLNYKIIDGNFRDFNPKFPIGSITSQNPYPFDKVKEGRSIYLTINANKVPLTSFPDISDKTFRYAKNILESVNLNVGDIFYKNDIARHVVLKSEHNGLSIDKSDSLPIFSKVDLYIGTGLPKNQFGFKVPELHGLLLQDAVNRLKKNFLNLGVVYFDNLIEDSLNLVVYKQSEEPTNSTKFFNFSYKTKAPSVDLWVTNDSTQLIN